MGKIGRRRLAASAATLSLLAKPCAADHAAAPTLNAAAAFSSAPPSKAALTTAFSCGTHWTTAQSCGALCPSGRDADCPPGEGCYAGISCASLDEGTSMDDVLDRQARMESREMERLQGERSEGYVDRFVCGTSYEEAEAGCASVVEENSAGTKGVTSEGEVGAYYCPTGNSRQCPTHMQCYAAVSCPRHSHEEEPPLMDVVSSWRLNSLATEPMLFHVEANATEIPSLMQEGWGSPRSLLGSVASSLSSRHGLN